MLIDFFKLNGPYTSLDVSSFDAQLGISKHLTNISLIPGKSLNSKKIKDKHFENVSFSKTTIEKVTFTNCQFTDCLFIGASLIDVEFHDCSFDQCNFYKCSIDRLYAKPIQFKNAITEKRYSNVAIHLYQQLNKNYSDSVQLEYKNETAYYFHRWQRIQNHSYDIGKKKRYHLIPKYCLSFLHDRLFGYGYKLTNIFVTSIVTILFFIALNHAFSSYLFGDGKNGSLVESIYLTITTMITLGSSGYQPDTEVGYLVVMLNALVGVIIIGATINSIVRKVTR